MDNTFINASLKEKNLVRVSDLEVTESEIQDRLVKPFLIVAESILNEGVVSDSDIFDAGIILGAGFPKWTGGPINYARQKGIYQNLIGKTDAQKP
jgi:hypothetical protein